MLRDVSLSLLGVAERLGTPSLRTQSTRKSRFSSLCFSFSSFLCLLCERCFGGFSALRVGNGGIAGGTVAPMGGGRDAAGAASATGGLGGRRLEKSTKSSPSISCLAINSSSSSSSSSKFVGLGLHLKLSRSRCLGLDEILDPSLLTGTGGDPPCCLLRPAASCATCRGGSGNSAGACCWGWSPAGCPGGGPLPRCSGKAPPPPGAATSDGPGPCWIGTLACSTCAGSWAASAWSGACWDACAGMCEANMLSG
mmetsp:Transcript_75416/g.213189  ORF Transcript_75416/g.213189 Transcript_75416/m.213189 type:complete len:253 (+) Transcript_75416:411-1169(+)